MWCVPVVVATMLMSVWTDSISCACCLCRAVLLLLATLSCLSKASMAAIWVLTTDWETNIHSCWTTFSWPQTSYITFMTVSVYISQLRLKYLTGQKLLHTQVSVIYSYEVKLGFINVKHTPTDSHKNVPEVIQTLLTVYACCVSVKHTDVTVIDCTCSLFFSSFMPSNSPLCWDSNFWTLLSRRLNNRHRE